MLKPKAARWILLFLSFVMIVVFITSDVWFPARPVDHIRRYTRQYEFDYIGWELKAMWNKAIHLSFGAAHHLTSHQQRVIIEDYIRLLSQARETEQQLTALYSDPVFKDTDLIKKLEGDLALIKTQLKHQTGLAESVLQFQISQAIASLGITHIRTPFPPVLFQTTPLPKQLIISPRDTIRKEMSVSLIPDISLAEMVAIEELVEEYTDYSALVVPIGGVGTYPSMIIETTALTNLLDTAAHEWIHNHLTFRPLGARYSASPALRTMNETTASIAGGEIMRETLRIFYPEYSPLEVTLPENLNASNQMTSVNPGGSFNFSQMMYETRIQVDELLADGKIDEAEEFMENQRQFFWENGYQIRKLNQAYFSFYGAYADAPFSAAGRDPVGEDVRSFRTQQPDLATFIWKISWMLDYRQLRMAARAF
jgi:hypothetical protein